MLWHWQLQKQSYIHNFNYIFKMVKKNQVSNNTKQNLVSCSICMEKNARTEVDCHHKFCMRCITRWTKRNQTCPLCRHAITRIKYGTKIKIVEPRRKPVPVVHTTSTSVGMRIAWKPLIFISIPYFNYFVSGANLIPSVHL